MWGDQMFGFFRDRREQLALMNGFEEAAALTVWTLIKVIEDNQHFFEEHQDEYERAKTLLDKGLIHSENNNHRVAYIHFVEFINHAIENYPELVMDHSRLLEAVIRLRKLEKETIQPLWNRHHDKLVRR